MNIRQNEETDVICDKAEPSPLQVWRPAYPHIPMTTFEGCSTPAQQGHRAVAQKRHIPQGLSYNGAKPEIMVSIHECIPYFTLSSYDRADNERIGYKAILLGLLCARKIVCHNYVIYDSPEKNQLKMFALLYQ